MKNNLLYLLAAVLLGVLALLLSDPFMVWMPKGMYLVALLLAAVLVGAWAGFVMRERARDEREAQHSMYAGRIAYLAGIAVLVVALLAQGFREHIDPWIPLTLVAMVFAKLAARIYLDHRQ